MNPIHTYIIYGSGPSIDWIHDVSGTTYISLYELREDVSRHDVFCMPLSEHVENINRGTFLLEGQTVGYVHCLD